MKEQLENLSKEQLIKLCSDILMFHESHYKNVDSLKDKGFTPSEYLEKLDAEVSNAFYQFAGNIQGLRNRNGLPKLY